MVAVCRAGWAARRTCVDLGDSLDESGRQQTRVVAESLPLTDHCLIAPPPQCSQTAKALDVASVMEAALREPDLAVPGMAAASTTWPPGPPRGGTARR